MDLTSRLLGHDIKIHGYVVDSGTSLQNLYDLAQNLSLPAIFGQTTGVQLDISSSSASDTAAGTGAQAVQIIGLGPNLVPQTDIVATVGQAGGLAGSKYWTRVFAATVQATGSGLAAAGDIYLVVHGSSTWTAGVPQTLTSALIKIVLGLGSGYSGYWTVPADKTGALKKKGKLFTVMPSGAIQNARFLLQAQPNLETDANLATVWETVISGLTAGATGWVDLRDQQEDFSAGTDIIMKVIPLVAAGAMSAHLHIRYE